MAPSQDSSNQGNPRSRGKKTSSKKSAKPKFQTSLTHQVNLPLMLSLESHLLLSPIAPPPTPIYLLTKAQVEWHRRYPFGKPATF